MACRRRAGVHGYEFAPILAADRLAREISPSELAGTFIIVRVAHVPAYEDRVPYVNPINRKNLNRSFPGSAKGTQTERIAHLLSSVVIPAADFVFDVHSGDGAEWLEAFLGVYGGPLASEYETALGAAEAMGFPEDQLPRVTVREEYTPALWNDPDLVIRGVAAMKAELGDDAVVSVPKEMGGEDFSRYGRTSDRIPSFMIRLGTVPDALWQKAQRGEARLPSLHSPYFAPDPEPTLATGRRALTAIALDLLASP